MCSSSHSRQRWVTGVGGLQLESSNCMLFCRHINFSHYVPTERGRSQWVWCLQDNMLWPHLLCDVAVDHTIILCYVIENSGPHIILWFFVCVGRAIHQHSPWGLPQLCRTAQANPKCISKLYPALYITQPTIHTFCFLRTTTCCARTRN